MKNKKSLLSLGLVALVLVLGVGYAVVSSVDLTISGTASANSDLKVTFKSATSTSDKVTATAEDGKLKADITVENLTYNEEVTATYTIQNKEVDVDALVKLVSIENDNEDYFTVTADIDETGKTIAAGGTETIDVIVTVKLIATPLTETDSKANIVINLLAEPVVQ